MRSRHIILDLQQHRLDIVAFERTARRESRRLSVDLDLNASEWIREVRRLGSVIGDTLREMNVGEGQPCRVIYRSPSQSVDLSSTTAKSPTQAVNIATLSCLDALSFNDALPVTAGSVITRDPSGEEPKYHTVVAADREDVAAAIVTMVEEAGLRFESATPGNAALMGHLIRRATRNSKSLVATLYVGDDSSFFLIARERELVFARRIGLGLDTLVTGLCRPIKLADGSTHQMTRDEATALLHEHGFPTFDQILSKAPEISGRQIIPLLQPALQRLMVEMRQSLRFGLPGDEQPPVSIIGPGAALPGLARLLSEELSVDIQSPEQADAYDPQRPGARGSTLIDAVRDLRLLDELNIQPQDLAVSRRSSMMRRWLWCGAAAALGILAFYGVMYEAQIGVAEAKAATYLESAAEREKYIATRQRLFAGIAAISEVERSIDREMSVHIDGRSIMQELTLLTPDAIRFTTIDMSNTEDGVLGKVSGFLFASRLEPGTTGTIQAFVQSLKQSPLFTDVTLGSVQSGSIGQEHGQRFDASFLVVPAAVQLDDAEDNP